MSFANLGDVFIGLAERWPDRRAVVSPRLSLSYGALLERAAQSARLLRSYEILPGANVGIALRDGAETIVMMIAVWMLGATAVPADFRANAKDLDLLASDFDLVAILVDRPIGLAKCKSILIDLAWDDVIARYDATPIFGDEGHAQLAVISLTSGTTGQPTGVGLDHHTMLLRSACGFQRFGTVFLNPLLLSFSASRSYTLNALLRGVTVYFYPILFAAEELTDAILARKVTSACFVPTMIRSLLEFAGDRSSPLFEGMDALHAVGAPLSPEEKLRTNQVLCRNFVDGYGATVCGPVSSLHGADLAVSPETVGRVLPWVIVQIVDENDTVLPLGEAGVIRVRSPGMARAILGKTARNSGDTIKDGWAYPGDIGVLSAGGLLRLLGRTTDLIIRGGANVHPAEVEAVLAEHEGVHEVAVVGFAQSREGEEIAAFVVPRGTLTEAMLIAHCRARLTPDKRPRRFMFVPELPRNANGKVSRAKLREQLEARA